MAPGNLIDGRAISRQLLEELRARVDALTKRGVRPGLAFVRVGEDPASKVYVGRKKRHVLSSAFILKRESCRRKHRKKICSA